MHGRHGCGSIARGGSHKRFEPSKMINVGRETSLLQLLRLLLPRRFLLLVGRGNVSLARGDSRQHV